MNNTEASFTTFVIALTGGIASGKTAVSTAFSKLGATVVDTDVIAREVVLPSSEGLGAIQTSFGSRVIRANGRLNRNVLRDIIFSDAEKRLQLEAILHPLIHAESISQLKSVVTPIAILVIPLLAEGMLKGNTYKWVDRVLVVDVKQETQVRRLTARDGINATKARLILASQATRAQRLAIADDIIINNSTLGNLRTKTAELYKQYTQLAHD